MTDAITRLTQFSGQLHDRRQSFKGAFAAVYGHMVGGQKRLLRADIKEALRRISDELPY